MKKKILIALSAAVLLAGCGETPSASEQNTFVSGTSGKDAQPNSTPVPASSLSDKDYFFRARNSLVKADTKGFEYDYKLTVNATVSALSVQGIQQGTTKYNPTSSVSYLDRHDNSGLLFNDGTIYEYVHQQTKSRVELNEDNEVVKYSTETSNTEYKYDSSSFAKAIFTYTESDIKSITKTSDGYQIKTKSNATNVASTILKYVDHPIVEAILKKDIPDVDNDAGFFVTYANDNLKTYTYEFTLAISAITLTVKYEMDFKNVDQAVAISKPTFPGFYSTSSELTPELNKIKTSITSYKGLEDSSDEFKLKTAVDFSAAQNAIDTTIKGKSKRHVSGGVSYFANLIEVDSDLKNADLYKSQDLKDFEWIRGRLEDGTVYDREKVIIGYKDGVEVTAPTTSDDYFLLLDESFFNTTNVEFLNIKDGATLTYVVSLTKQGREKIVKFMSDNAILHPYVTTDATVLGNYSASTIVSNATKLEIKTNRSDNKLVSITLDMNGRMDTKFNNSRDFTAESDCEFDIDYEFKVTSEGTYTPPSEVKDLKY